MLSPNRNWNCSPIFYTRPYFFRQCNEWHGILYVKIDIKNCFCEAGADRRVIVSVWYTLTKIPPYGSNTKPHSYLDMVDWICGDCRIWLYILLWEILWINIWICKCSNWFNWLLTIQNLAFWNQVSLCQSNNVESRNIWLTFARCCI